MIGPVISGTSRALIVGMLLAVSGLASGVEASPIYVFRQRDGTIRFTNRPPPVGVQAKVFTASKAGFSIIGGFDTRLKPLELIRRYQEVIDAASRDNQIEPALIKAIIHAESSCNPNAVSPKGALGLMQLMPDTARWLGVRRPFLAHENIQGGARYLAKLLRKYSGNLTFALAAYNAGEVAVERYGGVPPYDETRAYVRRVLALRDRYSVQG